MVNQLSRRVKALEDASQRGKRNDPNLVIPLPSIALDGTRCIVHRRLADATDDELLWAIALHNSDKSFEDWLSGVELDC
jgi:TolB-like protein